MSSRRSQGERKNDNEEEESATDEEMGTQPDERMSRSTAALDRETEERVRQRMADLQFEQKLVATLQQQVAEAISDPNVMNTLQMLTDLGMISRSASLVRLMEQQSHVAEERRRAALQRAQEEEKERERRRDRRSREILGRLDSDAKGDDDNDDPDVEQQRRLLSLYSSPSNRGNNNNNSSSIGSPSILRNRSEAQSQLSMMSSPRHRPGSGPMFSFSGARRVPPAESRAPTPPPRPSNPSPSRVEEPAAPDDAVSAVEQIAARIQSQLRDWRQGSNNNNSSSSRLASSALPPPPPSSSSSEPFVVNLTNDDSDSQSMNSHGDLFDPPVDESNVRQVLADLAEEEEANDGGSDEESSSGSDEEENDE